MSFINYELDGKTYSLTDTQAYVIDNIMPDDPKRAEALIRRYAIRIVAGKKVIKEKEQQKSSGKASQGFTSTFDT